MSKKSTASAKSIFKNVVFGFTTWFFPLFLSFFATPIIVISLGNEDYGIYALVLGFIGYSFNFGIGRAVTKYIAEYLLEDDFKKISEVISTTLFLNLLVGLVGLFSILILAEWFVQNVFQIKGEEAQLKTINALYISSAIIFFTMLNQVFVAIIQGIQRFDTFSKIFNIQSFALLAGNLILALTGFGLISLLLWNLLVICLTSLITALISKRLLPEYFFSFHPTTQTLKLVLKYSAAIIGYQIMSNFLLLFERGWITRKLGPESLTFYVIPMMLGIYLHSFISSLMLVIFPLASELNQNKTKLLKLYSKSIKLVCFFVFFIGSTLIVTSNEFLFLWMGSEFAEKSSELLIIHTITYSLVAILIIPWQITEGLGYPKYNTYAFILCLFISLILMFNLIEPFGISGVAFGRFAGFGVLFLFLFIFEKLFFKKVQIYMWLKIFGVLTISGVLSGFVERLILNELPIGWLTLILTVSLGGVIYLALVWVFGFINEEDKLILKNILKVS